MPTSTSALAFSRPAVAAQSTARWCPRCDQPTLQEETTGVALIDRCIVCNGVWLDDGELEALAAQPLPARLRRQRPLSRTGRNPVDSF